MAKTNKIYCFGGPCGGGHWESYIPECLADTPPEIFKWRSTPASAGYAYVFELHWADSTDVDYCANYKYLHTEVTL